MSAPLRLAPLLALSCGAVAAVPDGAPADAASGADAGFPADEACLACHEAVGASWALGSSHALLYRCADCHAPAAAEPGPGHAARPGCAGCHSNAAHPDGAACTTCHDQHGAANAFLVRAAIPLSGGGEAAVSLTAPEGASAQGLARAGVPGEAAGTGLCEVCHDATEHYRADGAGEPHETVWCPTCHDHQQGFAPDAP